MSRIEFDQGALRTDPAGAARWSPGELSHARFRSRSQGRRAVGFFGLMMASDLVFLYAGKAPHQALADVALVAAFVLAGSAWLAYRSLAARGELHPGHHRSGVSGTLGETLASTGPAATGRRRAHSYRDFDVSAGDGGEPVRDSPTPSETFSSIARDEARALPPGRSKRPARYFLPSQRVTRHAARVAPLLLRAIRATIHRPILGLLLVLGDGPAQPRGAVLGIESDGRDSDAESFPRSCRGPWWIAGHPGSYDSA